jgi:hypothetical protein
VTQLETARRIHPAWWVAAVTFLALVVQRVHQHAGHGPEPGCPDEGEEGHGGHPPCGMDAPCGLELRHAASFAVPETIRQWPDGQYVKESGHA